MTKKVKVVAYDDLHDKLDGELVEADHEDVPLRFGPREVLLDLTGAHYAELAALLDKVFAVGTAPEPEKKPAAKKPAAPKPARKHPAAKQLHTSPYSRYTAHLTLAETIQWLRDLRAWADAQGRTAEYQAARVRKDGSIAKFSYYPVRLVEDYVAARREAAEAADARLQESVRALAEPREQPEEQRAAG